MSIQGALAASLRRFDPSPGAILDLRFKGDRETGYRPFFKREGIIYPTLQQVRGFSSPGGAGFAKAEINDAWRDVAPDAPILDDDGLGVWEARQEIVPLSCRPADGAWAIASGAGGKAVGTPVAGIFQSAVVTSAGANWHRLQIPAGPAVTSGQLYTVIARYRAGSSGRVRVALRNTAGDVASPVAGAIGALAVTEQVAGALSIIEDVWETPSIRRTVLAWTPNFTGAITSTGIGPDSFVAGQSVEVLGLSIKPYPYIASPPIDNGNLAATRTASAPQISGINGPPVGALLAEWEQPILRGATSTSLTYVWNINDGGDSLNANFCLRARRGTRAAAESIAAVIGDGTGVTVVTAPPPSPGTINRALISYDATQAGSKFTLNGVDQHIGRQVVASVLQNAVVGLGNGGAQRGNSGQFNSALRRLIWLPYFPSEAERLALTSG